MKRIIFLILTLLTVSLSHAQPNFGGSNNMRAMRPIWTAQQPSYFNANMDRNVNVYVSRNIESEDAGSEFVIFDIAGTDEFADLTRQSIMFFDIPKLLGALDVCYETLNEVSKLSSRARTALIAGMDTIFPRAAVVWHDNDTLVASYNNVLRPDIRIENGQAKLIITGNAVCRIKFNETINDPSFSGDADVTTEYSLVFSTAREVLELETIIQNSVSQPNRRIQRMVPQHAFPRTFDRNFRPGGFNDFMRRFNPRWNPISPQFEMNRRPGQPS